MIFYELAEQTAEQLEIQFAQHVTRTDEDGTPSQIQIFIDRGHHWVAKLFNGRWVYCYDAELFAGDPNHPTSQGRPFMTGEDEMYLIAFCKFQRALRHWFSYKGVAF